MLAAGTSRALGYQRGSFTTKGMEKGNGGNFPAEAMAKVLSSSCLTSYSALATTVTQAENTKAFTTTPANAHPAPIDVSSTTFPNLVAYVNSHYYHPPPRNSVA